MPAKLINVRKNNNRFFILELSDIFFKQLDAVIYFFFQIKSFTITHHHFAIMPTNYIEIFKALVTCDINQGVRYIAKDTAFTFVSANSNALEFIKSDINFIFRAVIFVSRDFVIENCTVLNDKREIRIIIVLQDRKDFITIDFCCRQFTVKEDRYIIKQCFWRHLSQLIGLILIRLKFGVDEFISGTQVSVTPSSRFALVTELSQRCSAKNPGSVSNIFAVTRKNHLVRHVGRNPVVAFSDIFANHGQHLFTAPGHHITKSFLGQLFWRKFLKVDRIGIVPTKIFLIHGFRIMYRRSIKWLKGPIFLHTPRQYEHVRNFVHLVAHVHIKERLIMDVLVNGRSFDNKVADVNCRNRFISIFFRCALLPVRPVMALENHVRLVAEALFRRKDIMRPGSGVPYLRPSQGIEVMHGPGAVFRKPQSAILREIGVHLRRRFRSRGELELYFQSIDDDGLVRCDLISRGNQACVSDTLPESDADGHFSGLTGFQQYAILIHGPAAHRGVAVDIL